MGNICDQICFQPLALHLFLYGVAHTFPHVVHIIRHIHMPSCEIGHINLIIQISSGDLMDSVFYFLLLDSFL